MGFAEFDIMGKCKKILSKLDLLGEEVEDKVSPLVDVLGQTNNTGGTNSSGSVMAKLNKLITDWTTTRAGYIDAIKSKTDLIGSSNEARGTVTTGSLMAKLNAAIPRGAVYKNLKYLTVKKTGWATTNGTEKTVTLASLTNVTLHRLYFDILGYSSTYYARVEVIMDGVSVYDNTVVEDTEYIVLNDAIGGDSLPLHSFKMGFYLSNVSDVLLSNPLVLNSLVIKATTTSNSSARAVVNLAMNYEQN